MQVGPSMRARRPLIAAAAVTAAALWPSAARADLPAGSGTPSFEVRTFNGTDYSKPNTTDLPFYFNLAHCVCSQAAAGTESDFQLYTTLDGATDPLHVPAEIWTGDGCDESQTTRDTNCFHVKDISDYGNIATTPATPLIPVYNLIDPLDTSCSGGGSSGTVWLLVSQTSGGTLDKAGSTTINYDITPPPLPTDFDVSGAENAIQIDFKSPVDNASDVLYYQALCRVHATGEPGQPDTSKRPDARYYTVNHLCGLDSMEFPLEYADVSANPADAGVGGTPDAMPGPDAAPSPGFERLDGEYLCGEASGTAPSLRIDNLENGTAYDVILVSVDASGNPHAVEFNQSVTPQPVTDFWEDLHSNGSNVQGGFCLISDTYGGGGPITQAMRAFRDDNLAASAPGRAFIHFYYAHVAWIGAWARAHLAVRVVFAIVLLPLIALALAWHALGLPLLLLVLVGGGWLWRRRGRLHRRTARAALAATTLALVWLGAGAAHAQGFQPYWAGDDAATAPVGEAQPDWVLGVKFGPYVPAIDSQAGVTNRPYHSMFGGYNVMPILELDRILLRGFGQVTVGGSVGFLGKSASAYKAGTTAGDPNRMRSSGDTNTFRLVPLSATASYRLTYLDDRYGIPLAPYVRGGLSYYVWWARAPSGSLSSVDQDGCTSTATMTCPQNKAAGATAGLQGSVGIEIRAERIDPNASASMRSSGIEHAGFYAEYQAAWVTGFGKDTKLAVGDNTWFVGFDFEF